MGTKHEAKSTITINASANDVWHALTTPALIKRYLMGADVHTDWKVGSPLVYTGSYEGKPFEEKGVIQKVVPNELLQATHFSTSSGKEDKPENYARVTWSLAPSGNATEVTVTQDNIDKPEGVAASEKNWLMVLKGLKKVVEET